MGEGLDLEKILCEQESHPLPQNTDLRPAAVIRDGRS